MTRFPVAFVVLLLPLLLGLGVMVLELAGQCRERAPLSVLCELATFGAALALVPAAIAGLMLAVRRGASTGQRLAAILVLFLYAVVIRYGNRLIAE